MSSTNPVTEVNGRHEIYFSFFLIKFTGEVFNSFHHSLLNLQRPLAKAETYKNQFHL